MSGEVVYSVPAIGPPSTIMLPHLATDILFFPSKEYDVAVNYTILYSEKCVATPFDQDWNCRYTWRPPWNVPNSYQDTAPSFSYFSCLPPTSFSVAPNTFLYDPASNAVHHFSWQHRPRSPEHVGQRHLRTPRQKPRCSTPYSSCTSLDLNSVWKDFCYI